jgi:multidrug efflux pump subunit AcrA (membrane-fusion protein)
MSRQMRKRTLTRWALAAVVLAALGGAAAYAVHWSGRATASPAAEPPPAEEGDEPAIEVTTVAPRLTKEFAVTAEAPAYVEPYYRADLEARVAGPVDSIQVAIGDRVAKGQELVRVYVPDLVAEVGQKNALIEQRKHEKALSEKMREVAQEAVATAQINIRLKQTLLGQAEAELVARNTMHERFKQLTRLESANPAIEVQTKKEAEAAQAAKVAAEVAVEKARSDLKEAAAKLAAAEADVMLKGSLIDVAKSDLQRATAMLNLAVIDAPFKGKITQRNVDPGSFVQNAATARAKPLLSLERIDIVTVYAKLPDNYARYVTPNTEAVIHLRDRPGLSFHGRVTRFSDSLQNPQHDRTMRVEVDLYNGTAAEYEQFQAEEKGAPRPYADLKNTLRAARTGRAEDKLPALPVVKGRAGADEPEQLIPGMYGRMQLLLRTYSNVYLIPSYALVHEGGKSYLYLVKNGTAQRAEVRLRADNGKLARVALVGEDGGARRLSGDEEIVASNQGELSDGQAVTEHRLGTNW